MGKRAEKDLPGLLAESLAALDGDKGDVGAPSAGQSVDGDACRDLVSLALELRQMPSPAPTASYRSEGYRSLMREIRKTSNRPDLPSRILGFAGRALAVGGLRTAPVWVSACMAAIVCLSTAGVVMASADSLPGDALYGLKTTVEDVRLAVSPAEVDALLHARFAERRLDEMKAAVAAGRVSDGQQAVAEYEVHVGQALLALSTAGGDDANVRGRLAIELGSMLSEQAGELGALAGQMPEPMASAVQQARSTSVGAQDAIERLRVELGSQETTGEVSPTSTPEPTMDAPDATATQEDHPLPADPTGMPNQPHGAARPTAGKAPDMHGTPAVVETPLASPVLGARIAPVVDGTPMPPPADGSGSKTPAPRASMQPADPLPALTARTPEGTAAPGTPAWAATPAPPGLPPPASPPGAPPELPDTALPVPPPDGNPPAIEDEHHGPGPMGSFEEKVLFGRTTADPSLPSSPK